MSLLGEENKRWNVCCCIYHVEMEELKVGLNHTKQKSRLHLESHCDCEAICGSTHESPFTCVGSHAICLGKIRLWETIMCYKDPHYEWHA